MKTFLLLVLIQILLIQVKSDILPHDGELISSQSPEFHFDLNVEPYHRWDHIIPTFKEKMHIFVKEALDIYDIPEETYKELGVYMENNYKYQDIIQELKGIGAVSGIMWEKLLFANLTLELTNLPMCTSILVKNIEGKVLHGRNLDFPYWRLMSQTNAKLKVYKGSKYIGTWFIQVGSILVLTGETPGKISVSIDSRYDPLPVETMIDNVFVKQYILSGYLTREVLSQELGFKSASEALLNSDVTAPIYYNLGGTEEGMIIEKKSIGYNNYHTFDNSDSWYMVQTNFDWDMDPNIDVRRTIASKRLQEIGQENINENNLFDLMATYPTLNIASVYSSVLSATYDYAQISLWYGNVNSDYLQERGSQKQFNLRKQIKQKQQYKDQQIQNLVNEIKQPNFFKNLENKLQRQNQILE